MNWVRGPLGVLTVPPAVTVPVEVAPSPQLIVAEYSPRAPAGSWSVNVATFPVNETPSVGLIVPTEVPVKGASATVTDADTEPKPPLTGSLSVTVSVSVRGLIDSSR